MVAILTDLGPDFLTSEIFFPFSLRCETFSGMAPVQYISTD